jgi:hypothetical protein
MSVGSFVRSGFLVGTAVGAGLALFGPALWRAARPHIRDVMKAGMTGFASASAVAARAAEEVEDLVAEVAHDLRESAGKSGAEEAAATVAAEDDLIHAGKPHDNAA